MKGNIMINNKKEKRKKVIAVLTAGGTGQRMQQDIPKQFIHIENKPLIIYTLEAFQSHPNIDVIIVACLEGWQDILKAYAKQFNITKLKHIVTGGATGQESIYNCLVELKKYYAEDSTIVVHDGNRGLVPHEVISDALSVYSSYGSAVAAIPCIEAVFVSEDGYTASKEIPRKKLYRTQTPHVYSLKKMLWAHNEAKKRHLENTTATCSLMNILGEEVHFSRGSEKNMKITTIEDIELFEAILHTKKENWLK